MSRVVTTADVLESFANLLYGKARENLEQVLLDRDLLGDVEHGLRGQILHQFATDALVCLRAAGRVAPEVEGIPAMVYALERLARIIGLGIPPADRLAEAFRLRVQGMRADDRAGYADAEAQSQKVLGAALLDYLDDRCQPGEGLPPE